MSQYDNLNEYEHLNKLAIRNKTVILGSGKAEKLNLNEVLGDFSVDTQIYNRSLESLNLKKASNYYDKYIDELKPNDLIIYLGESEAKNENIDTDEFLNDFRLLVYHLKHVNPDCKLYFVGIVKSPDTDEKTLANEHALNSCIKKIAKENKMEYVEIPSDKEVSLNLRFFKAVKDSLFDRKMNFARAYNYSRI